MTGSQEVSGSIPLISTTGKPGKLVLMKVKTSFFLFQIRQIGISQAASFALSPNGRSVWNARFFMSRYQEID